MRVRLGDLTVDADQRSVSRDGVPIRLPDLSFDALVALVRAAPEPLSAGQLAAAVWRIDHVSAETVAQRLTLLRKALGDDPKNPAYIRTVRGRGYAACGPVETVATEEAFTARPVRNPGMMAAVVCVGLVAVAVLAVSWPDSDRSAGLTEPSASAVLTDRAQAHLSLHQSAETDTAIGLLRDALEADPDDLSAQVTLSFALTTRATKFRALDTDRPEAEALARSVIETDRNHSNAWSALAYSLGSQGRIDEALSAYRRAYDINPANAPALSSAAHLHLLRGDLHRALQLEFRSRRAGGRSRYAEVQIAQSLDLIGHPAAADWYAEALRLNPGQVVVVGEIARSHIRQGDPAAALESLASVKGDDAMSPAILRLRSRAALSLDRIEEARRHLAAAGTFADIEAAALDASLGDASAATALLQGDMVAKMGDTPDPQFRVVCAELAASVGRLSLTHDWLSQAVDLGWRDVGWLRHSPFLRSYLETQDGQALMERLDRILAGQRESILSSPDFSAALTPEG
ncbi:MAG: winged helix-turn-helix domain-containing protein [Litorimonas sp.]